MKNNFYIIGIIIALLLLSLVVSFLISPQSTDMQNIQQKDEKESHVIECVEGSFDESGNFYGSTKSYGPIVCNVDDDCALERMHEVCPQGSTPLVAYIECAPEYFCEDSTCMVRCGI